MDVITAWALSIHNPLIRATGLFLDQDFFYTIIIIGLVILGEWKNDKRQLDEAHLRKLVDVIISFLGRHIEQVYEIIFIENI